MLEQKEEIVKIVNTLIELIVNKDRIKEDKDNEINDYYTKIGNMEQKKNKLLDMYLNDLLLKDEYENKRSIFDRSINDLKERIKIAEEQRKVTKESLENKIDKLKNIVENNLNYENGMISEELIDSFIDSIKVTNDSFDWKLNYFNDIEEREDILLTTLEITKDDIYDFINKSNKYKLSKARNIIKVNIYI